MPTTTVITGRANIYGELFCARPRLCMARSFDSHRDSVKVGTVVTPPLWKKKLRHGEGECRADTQRVSTELE